MKLTRSVQAAAFLCAGAFVLSACGGSSSSDTGGESTDSGLTGSVRVDGSSTVAPFTSAASELFKESNPKVNVTVGTSGTGGGFEKFCRGETDINDASRPIKDEEAAICEKNGVEFQQLIVANDALSVITNASNDWAKCLTVEQLNKIWEPGSKVKNWNEIDPSFPDEALKLFGAGTDSGTFDYFTEAINGESGASRTDYTPSEDDNVTITGVAGSKGGMGYLGYTYYEENVGKVNALEIDSGAGCVTPSAETVQDETYTPLGRPLFVYVSINALRDNSAVAPFLEYVVSDDETIALAAQFIPLNEEESAELEDNLNSAKSAAGL